jgi:hypothetical protein
LAKHGGTYDGTDRDGAIQTNARDVSMDATDIPTNSWIRATGILPCSGPPPSREGRTPTIALVDSGIQQRRESGKRIVGHACPGTNQT